MYPESKYLMRTTIPRPLCGGVGCSCGEGYRIDILVEKDTITMENKSVIRNK
jgi:hypothetical protein